MKNLKKTGEFYLINKVIKKYCHEIGDDAAIFDLPTCSNLLATGDCQLEGRHFQKSWITPKNLGRKCANVNLSDIAAMGGYPLKALVSLGLPPNLSIDFIDQFYQGLSEEFGKTKTEIIGGNLVKSPKIFVDIFILGKSSAFGPVKRSGANPSDYLAVTDYLGQAAAGFGLLQKNLRPKLPNVFNKFFTPQARVKEGQLLAEKKLATAMIDLSDGLGADLQHLLQASQVKAQIWPEKIPICPQTKKAAKILGIPALDLATGGGEDYELLFTSRPENFNLVKKLLKPLKVTKIGQIISPNQKPIHNLTSAGWDHFL